MDEFGLVWLSSVWFDEVDFLKCSRSASQLSFTNLFFLIKNLKTGDFRIQKGGSEATSLCSQFVIHCMGLNYHISYG